MTLERTLVPRERDSVDLTEGNSGATDRAGALVRYRHTGPLAPAFPLGPEAPPARVTGRARGWFLGGDGRDLTPGWMPALASAMFVVLCMLQSPGKIASDTKLDVVLTPGRFLGAALHFWNGSSDFGFLPNQYAGYLFPMGPFFLLGHVLGVAPWITERLWWSLILAVALWGLVRLADALRIGRPLGRMAAGVAYTTSPFFLGKIGSNSIALTAGALLPWMLLPLLRTQVVADALGLPAPGRVLPGRRAAALSGLAIFATGGVNASVTLCVLLCPAALLVVAGRSRQAWALRGWWCLSVVLATAWWILPLSLQSRYGLNFLPFTESAAVTTSVTSSGEVLRGTADWLSYLRLPTPWVRAGFEYVSSPAAIAGSALVAAIGIFGLARPGPGSDRAGRDGIRTRWFLLLSLAAGAVAVGAAYSGHPSSPVADTVRTLLAGPLGFLRNVNKFEPVLRLPLALGVAYALSAVADKARTGPARRSDSPPARRQTRVDRRRVGGTSRAAQALAVALTAGAVIAGTTPALAGKVAPGGSFAAVPHYWTQAADWLGAHPDGGRTLVVPGSPFGEYSWGRPMDEPLQWLSKTPWGVRSLIPLGGTGVTRLLDAVENSFELGSAPGLSAALARAGVGQIVVRNDLGNEDWDAPPSTDQIHRALASSGLVKVGTFGPQVPAKVSAQARLLPALSNTKQTVPALEIWEVPTGASKVSAYPAAATKIVSGGPEATVQLAAHGLLGAGATITAGDLTAADTSGPTAIVGPTTTWADTDTLTRRDTAFGLVHGGSSYLLAAGQNVAGRTGAPRQWLDTPTGDHQTVAGYLGGVSVTASSYGFSLAAAPDLAPGNAVDGNPATSWQAAVGADGSTGAWLRVALGREVAVPSMTVRLLEDGSFRPAVHALRVTTERGSVVTRVKPDESNQTLVVPSGATSWITVSFEDVTSPRGSILGAGIRELTIPGVTISRYVQAPSDVAGLFTSPASGPVDYTFDRFRSDPTLPFGGDEEQQLIRRFDVPKAMTFTVTGAAVAIPPFDGRKPAARTGPLTIPCGAGPAVTVDGTRYPTEVTGRQEDLSTFQPMTLRLCPTAAHLALGPGQHLVSVEQAASGVTVSGLTLASTSRSATAAATPRTTTATSWSDERRTVAVGAGAASLLAVHENFNRSWTASLDGHDLRAIRIDGWQQGFVVPAGAAGTVVIVNNPGRAYQRDLVIGGLGVLLLLALALARSFGRLGRLVRSRRAASGSAPAGAVRWGPRATVVAGLGLATLAVFLLAGPVAVVVPVVAAVTWRLPYLLAWFGGGAMVVDAIVVAREPANVPGSGSGAFSVVVQIAGALAVGCVILAGTRAAASRTAAGSRTAAVPYPPVPPFGPPAVPPPPTIPPPVSPPPVSPPAVPPPAAAVRRPPMLPTLLPGQKRGRPLPPPPLPPAPLPPEPRTPEARTPEALPPGPRTSEPLASEVPPPVDLSPPEPQAVAPPRRATETGAHRRKRR